MRISDWSSDVCSSDLVPGIIGTEISVREQRQDHKRHQCKARDRIDFLCRHAFEDGVGLRSQREKQRRHGCDRQRLADLALAEIGRASCRARVCPSGSIWVVAVSIKKKKKQKNK